MANNVREVEIFRVGKWRGNRVVDVTESDLDDMVSSFNDLTEKVEGFRPHLKLGHDENQRFFGGRKGSPSLGFVEKIWRHGDKILANFSNVPDALIDLIKNGRYNSVSIEVVPTVDFEGNTFKSVLLAVALLGAELPAVKGLKDLALSLFQKTEKVYEFGGESVILFQEAEPKEPDMATTFTQEQHDALVEKAVKEAVDAAKTGPTAEITKLSETVETLKTEKATAQAALRDYVQASETKEAEALVDIAIEKGTLLPAQKETALAFMASMTGTVKLGDSEKPAKEAFKDFIEMFGGKVDLSEKTGHDKTPKGEVLDDPSAEVDRLSRALVAEKKAETYSDAMHMVLAQDDELKQRYMKLEE